MKILSLVYYFRKTVLYFTLTAGNALNIFSKMGFDDNCLDWSATPCRSPVTREKCVFHMEKVVIFHTNYDQLRQSANSQSSHSMPEWELHLAIARDSNQSGNTYFSLATGGHKGVANQSVVLFDWELSQSCLHIHLLSTEGYTMKQGQHTQGSFVLVSMTNLKHHLEITSINVMGINFVCQPSHKWRNLTCQSTLLHKMGQLCITLKTPF